MNWLCTEKHKDQENTVWLSLSVSFCESLGLGFSQLQYGKAYIWTNIQAHTSKSEWQFMVTSKTASSPPCSLNFSLKFPPVFRTDPEVSEYKKNIKILRRCFDI